MQRLRGRSIATQIFDVAHQVVASLQLATATPVAVPAARTHEALAGGGRRGVPERPCWCQLLVVRQSDT